FPLKRLAVILLNIRRPRTTVGIAIKLFRRITASRFSGKSDKPIAIPIGSPNNDAITVDHPAVLTEVQTAAYTSRSAEKISENAVPSDCASDPTVTPSYRQRRSGHLRPCNSR